MSARTSGLVGLANRIPALRAVRTRTTLLRLAGVQVDRTAAVGGKVRLVGGGALASRLTIGRRCWINDGCLFDVSASITLGDGVAIGQQVTMLTSTHEIGGHQYRAGRDVNKPITVGAGSWIGARAVVLPGVTIGRGAVVAAGSVVTRSVDDDVLVGGVPAKFIRSL